MLQRSSRAWLVLALSVLLFSGLFTVVNSSIAQRNPIGKNSLGTPNHAASIVPNPGDLDQTFGDSGKATTIFYGVDGVAGAVVVQSDGRIVAAGGNSISRNFSLARFLPNGAPDYSFGTVGKVTTAIHANSDPAYVYSLALQPDGKIVAAGFATSSNGAEEFALVRYLSDGSLDPSFGSAGKVTTSVSGFADRGRAVAVQADGKICVAGTANGDIALVRFNADGTLDNSFGSLGKVSTDYISRDDGSQGLALQQFRGGPLLW